jgi:glutaredoxin
MIKKKPLKLLIVYTMEGCPWCDKFKDLLKRSRVKYKERDIEKFNEEYEMFKEATQNEFVPAFMILDVETERAELFAPDRDYQDLDEALMIVKGKL